jgi:hypothetical protein
LIKRVKIDRETHLWIFKIYYAAPVEILGCDFGDFGEKWRDIKYNLILRQLNRDSVK